MTKSESPIALLVRRMTERVLDGEGVTSPEARRAVVEHAARPPELGMLGVGSTSVEVRGPVPEGARSYVDKVCHAPARVMDEDVEALRAAGLSEDEIFELTVAAALGAGLVRYRIGMQLLGRSS